MTLLDDLKRLRAAVDDFKMASAPLACGSSSCAHSADKGGQMVNGPCRCYPHTSSMREFVYAAANLRAAAVNLLPPPDKPTKPRSVKR